MRAATAGAASCAIDDGCVRPTITPTSQAQLPGPSQGGGATRARFRAGCAGRLAGCPGQVYYPPTAGPLYSAAAYQSGDPVLALPSSSPPRGPVARTVLAGVVLAGVAAVIGTAGAGPVAEPAWQPRAFSATYRVRYDLVPFAARGERSLRIEGERWHFRSLIDAKLFSLEEEATLAARPDGSLLPLSYRYRQRGLVGRRDRLVTFDRGAGLVRRTGDKVRQHPLQEPAWDPLGWQLALQQDLVRDHPTLAARYHYRVSDGGGYEDYSFVPGARETMPVPAGTFEALRLERDPVPEDEEATRLWLDPARDYLLLRMELVDEKGRELTVTLETPPAAAGQP